MRLLMDTNTGLRHALVDDPLHSVVDDALVKVAAERWQLCLAPQNVMEFWVVATRPKNVNGMGLSPAEAEGEVLKLLWTFALLRDPADLLDRWFELCTRYGVSGRPAHDARLVAFMLGHGITHILTLNPSDFARYTEIQTINPVGL